MTNSNHNEKEIIKEVSQVGGLLRKFMSKEEIKTANMLVKKGEIRKGTSDDKQKSVAYFNI